MKKRICPICEAACGLKISNDGREVIAIEPNHDDVFSNGHACAKGLALKELDADPARLRVPRIKENGEFRDASWDEAYALVQSELNRIRQRYGANSVATYVGNPTAHNIGVSFGLGPYMAGLGSTNFYSAGSVDQLPKQLASELMFGNDMAIPVPDITRCDYLLMLGANPAVSNGSLWIVPKFRQHLRDLQKRGSQLVTVDPRRSETARLADQHHFIRPGTDVWFLAAIINELLQLGCRPDGEVPINGFDELCGAIAHISATTAEKETGISAEAIQKIALDLQQAKAAAVYGRVGTTLQAFGTLTSFLIEVVNLLTGNLDRTGGAMFAEQPFEGPPSVPSEPGFNRYQSRVSHHPEVLGQLPLVALAEEILTPGEGQIRALLNVAGNPVVSGPDSQELDKALSGLEFMLAVDIYENETTRHADVILPATSVFEKCHYDHFLGAMGYRNAARYSPPLFDTEQPGEWDVMLTLGYCLHSEAPPSEAELQGFEDNVVLAAIVAHTDNEQSPLYGRDAQEILGQLPEKGVERLLDLGIRAGKWGDKFGLDRDGLTLQKMIDNPDGVDLGELSQERLSDVLKTPSGCIELAPSIILEDVKRLTTDSDTATLRLIGRRSVNTNNSWLHNLPMLTKGKSACVLEIHPEDAKQRSLTEGQSVKLFNEHQQLEVTVALTNDIAKGVVSLPHGFTRDMSVLPDQSKGANYNAVVATDRYDAISRTAALNGVPVEVAAL